MAFNVSYLYEIIDKFSPQIKKITAGALKAEKAINKLSSSSRMLDKNLGRVSKTINKVQVQKLAGNFNLSAQAAKKLNAATSIGADKLEKMNRAIRNTPKGQNLISLSKRSAAMAASVSRTNDQLANMRRQLTMIKATGLPLKTTSFAPVTAQVNKLTSALSRARSQADSLRGQLFDTAAAAFIFTRPIKSAIDFESAMADVRKVVDFKTPAQFAEMQKTIKQLGIDTSIGAKGMADIVTAGGQLGINVPELPDFALTVAKAAIAFDMLPGVAADALANISNRMKIPIKNIESVADAINHLSNTTAAKAPSMINILSRVSGAMSAVKMPKDAAVGFAAFAAQVETTQELAASGLNQMFIAIAKRKELASVLPSLLKAPQKTIIKLLTQLDKLGEEKKFKVIIDLFGAEAGKFVLKAVGNLDLLNKTLDKVSNKTKFANSVTKEYEIRQKTTGKALARLSAEFNIAAINLTTGLLPSIVEGSIVLAGMTSNFASFSEANPAVVNAIMLTVGGLIAFRLATIATMFTFNQFKIALLQGESVLKFLKLDVLVLTPAMAALRGGVLATAINFRMLGVTGGAAALGLNAMSIAANIAKFAVRGLLIATGIGALLVGLGLLIENWDLIKQKTVEYFNIAKAFAAPFLGMLGSIGSSMGGFVADLVEKFPILSQFGDMLIGIFSGPLKLITALQDKIAGLLPSFESLKSVASFLVEKGSIGLGALTGGALGTSLPAPTVNKTPEALSPVIAKQQMSLSGNITVGATQNSQIQEAAFTSDFGNLGVNIE